MTTKQVFLSALILCATSNIALGMDSYGYPELPKQQCDFCDLDIKQYEKEYRNAANHQQKDIQKSVNILRQQYDAPEHHIQLIIQLHTSDINQRLRKNLSYITEQQQLCPAEYIAAKRNKKIETAIEIGFNQ